MSGGKATRDYRMACLTMCIHGTVRMENVFVFISDKSGSDNLWTMDLATKEQKQLTKDKNKYHVSADWSPDGDYIVGTRGRRNIKPFIVS